MHRTGKKDSITTSRPYSHGSASPSTIRASSISNYPSYSSTSLIARPRNSVRNEIIALMFDSMLNTIVKSWKTIEAKEGNEVKIAINRIMSDTEEKKKTTTRRMSKAVKSMSKIDVTDDTEHTVHPMQQVWFSPPDEKAVIHFRNGNMYEGDISMKYMHGEGRFQWSNGTVYIGKFHYNEIKGKGKICWKDDNWYEGDFVGNIRHGKGLYVKSHEQSSYYGGWHNGVKHGKGVIYYDGTFKNNYDGDWVLNVRHGYGRREYCALSGYEGEWDRYVRDGKGLMIWPNHDYYEGGWINGLMSGYGTYIWNAECNNTLSLPAVNVYRGYFQKGQRYGAGKINFGLRWGAYYRGSFRNDKKNGSGKIVTNDGLILQDIKLFQDDIVIAPENLIQTEQTADIDQMLNPLKFDISNEAYGLRYHIEKAYKNLDREAELQTKIINDFIENNRANKSLKFMKFKQVISIESQYDEDMLTFEEIALLNAVKSYQTNLIKIYDKYSEICLDEPASSTPQLLRLFLWQFYWDCNIHQKGLTLVEIDNIFFSNPAWLFKSLHNPFKKILYWQFLQSLVAVASKLYASKVLPGPKPDTIVARAFRKFMDEDVLPGYGRRCGHLSYGFGSFIPLKALYDLYRTLGEPHTVRKFICSVRRLPYDTDFPPVNLIDAPEDISPGYNAYIFGDQISYVMDDIPLFENRTKNIEESELNAGNNLFLFNFSNLSTYTLIKIFAQIFPQVQYEKTIMTLNIEMTFLEFFEAFVACAEESIRVKEKEKIWRALLEENNKGRYDYNIPPVPPPSYHRPLSFVK